MKTHSRNRRVAPGGRKEGANGLIASLLRESTVSTAPVPDFLTASGDDNNGVRLTCLTTLRCGGRHVKRFSCWWCHYALGRSAGGIRPRTPKNIAPPFGRLFGVPGAGNREVVLYATVLDDGIGDKIWGGSLSRCVSGDSVVRKQPTSLVDLGANPGPPTKKGNWCRPGR